MVSLSCTPSNLTYEQDDGIMARTTINYGSISTSCFLNFTTECDFKSLDELRYYYRKRGSPRDLWLVRIEKEGYLGFSGIRLPACCTVTWHLKESEFTWNWFRVEQVTYA